MIYLEVMWAKILIFFGYTKDTSVIPKNTVYCYVRDEERMKKEPIDVGYWVKTCPYYRTVNEEKSACTFVGYYGDSLLLNDSCKICGENYPE